MSAGMRVNRDRSTLPVGARRYWFRVNGGFNLLRNRVQRPKTNNDLGAEVDYSSSSHMLLLREIISRNRHSCGPIAPDSFRSPPLLRPSRRRLSCVIRSHLWASFLAPPSKPDPC